MKFKLGDVVYTAYKKAAVVRMSPYVPVNEKDETSCYATLLLYIPWPAEGEEGLLRGSESAVEALEAYTSKHRISSQVSQFFAMQRRSDEIMNNHGEAEIDVEALNQYESDSASSTGGDAIDGSEDENFLNVMDAEVVDDDDDDDDGSRAGSQDNREEEIVTMVEGDYISPSDAEVCVDKVQITQYEKFVENKLQEKLSSIRKENTFTAYSDSDVDMFHDEADTFDEDYEGEDRYEPLKDDEAREKAVLERIARFTPDQQEALLSVRRALLAKRKLTDIDTQVVQFVTGGAGVGKSEYIQCVIEIVRLYYGRQRGFYGSVLAMAPTGAAAYNIGGMTWQSALGCEMLDTSKNGGGNLMSNERAVKFGEYMRSVKLIILDEVSMVSLQSLQEISKRIVEALSTVDEHYGIRSELKAAPFGGIHIIFCGDLYQLKCVTGSSIPNVTRNDLEVKAVTGRDLWYSLNRYVNFKVSTRYDGHTGVDLDRFLKGARVGRPDTAYIDRFNARMCITVEEAKRKTHPKAMWLASTKKEVDDINKFMYNDLVKRGNFAYDVVAHHTTSMERGGRISKKERIKIFKDTEWKTPRKSNITPGVLRLAIGSRVKLTENLATQLGIVMD